MGPIDFNGDGKIDILDDLLEEEETLQIDAEINGESDDNLFGGDSFGGDLF